MMKTATRASMALALLTSSVAVADTDPVVVDPNAPPPVGMDPAAAPTPNPDVVPSRYPRDIISRPLTYPAGLVAVGADVKLQSAPADFADPLVFRPLVGYGITDDLELNFVDFTFGSDSSVQKAIGANVGYKLVRGAMDGKLEAIGRVQVGYGLEQKDEVNGVDVVVKEAGAAPLLLGVHAQYNITPKLAVITPGQQLSIALESSEDAAGNSLRPITLSLPVAVGFQATPTAYVQLDTNLAVIEIADAETAVIFSDATPLAVTGFLNAIPALDVFAGLSLDATPANDGEIGDTLSIFVGARYYVGKL